MTLKQYTQISDCDKPNFGDYPDQFEMCEECRDCECHRWQRHLEDAARDAYWESRIRDDLYERAFGAA